MIYNIFHTYTVDGGIGDAVRCDDLVLSLDCTEDEVKEFVKKHSHPLVYDDPYDWMEFGELYYEPAPIPYHVQDVSDETLTDMVVGSRTIFLPGKSGAHLNDDGTLPDDFVVLDNEQTKRLWSGKENFPKYDAWFVT